MTAGIFVFGVLVTTMVAAACFLIVTGIRDEHRDRMELEREMAGPIAAGKERTTSTLKDGQTVDAN